MPMHSVMQVGQISVLGRCTSIEFMMGEHGILNVTVHRFGACHFEWPCMLTLLHWKCNGLQNDLGYLHFWS